MKINKVHCFFEQSGTFKNEFKKFGIPAEDYDILNDFGETDHVVDLFKDIENESGVFDKITSDDLIIAFFPCVRFTSQALLEFQGTNNGMKKWNIEKKLEYDIKMQAELTYLYNLVTRLVLIALRRNLRLIIENPYSSQHYLTTHWALKPAIIDIDRTRRGDFYEKPTQYWFVNCCPENNLIWEAQVQQKRIKKVSNENKVNCSMISKEYANRFIREYILDKEQQVKER